MGRWFLNFSFDGRARRSHAWANAACWWGVYIVAFAVAVAACMGRDTAPAWLVLLILPLLAVSTIDHLALTFRRAHDTGRTGWIWLLLMIPFVNFLALYWLLIEDSQQGSNKYGPPVKTFYEAPPAPAAA